MLVEMAIGDAYGAAFEFMDDAFVARENDLSAYKQNPQTQLGNGRYTDDTQMSVAIAEFLLSGEQLTQKAISDHFVTAFRRDERRGYSKRLHAILKGASSGGDFLESLSPTSTRSGAAMRVSPIGLLPNIERVLELAEFQAAITHDTAEGKMSACAIATMVHFLAYELGPRMELGKFIEANVPDYSWRDPWSGPVDMSGISCAHAAISLVQRATTLRCLLKDTIDLGGDTDTVAAIAMFSASLCKDIDKDLPSLFYEGLENNGYGLDFLSQLDSQLSDLVFAKVFSN